MKTVFSLFQTTNAWQPVQYFGNFIFGVENKVQEELCVDVDIRLLPKRCLWFLRTNIIVKNWFFSPYFNMYIVSAKPNRSLSNDDGVYYVQSKVSLRIGRDTRIVIF